MSEERPAPDDDATPEAFDATGQPPARTEPEQEPEREQEPEPAKATEKPADGKPKTPTTQQTPTAAKAPRTTVRPAEAGRTAPKPAVEPAPDASGASGVPRAPQPASHATADDDAWATACAEDLAAEKARRRARNGPQPGSAAEELRKLVDAVADRLSGFQSPLFGAVAGPAAQQVVRQVVQQAKAAVEPVIERNPDVFDHLAAAGGELLAAYRSAVRAQEKRWTERPPRPGDTPGDGWTDRREGGEGTTPGERIDLD